MEALKLILRNLLRQPRRTVLTALTIAGATLIYTVLTSVPASIDRIIEDFSSGLRVVVNNRSGPYGVPARYCDEIHNMPYVTGCVPINLFYLQYRDPREGIGTFAVDPEFARIAADYKVSPAQMRELAAVRRAALAGHALMRKYGWKLGQEIILRAFGEPFQMSFVLVGELPGERLPNNFVFRRDYLTETLRARGYTGEIRPLFLLVGVDSLDRIGMVIREIDDDFRNSDDETLTMTESDSIAGTLSAFGNIRAIIYSLCTIVLLSVLLIAANSMAMSVRERLGDVAVMRALGFGRGWVGVLLLGESVSIGAAGGLLGAAVALWQFAAGMNLGPLAGGFGTIQVSPLVAFQAFLVAIAISMLSALLPVLSAMRVSPAMAFRPIL